MKTYMGCKIVIDPNLKPGEWELRNPVELMEPAVPPSIDMMKLNAAMRQQIADFCLPPHLFPKPTKKT